MRTFIKKCPSCGRYTLKELCPSCGKKTSTPHPPKFSPDDRYWIYKRA
ncbi:MAG: RNA-protein complex protein Nop10 [Candidatus Bathyarchaeia archaeon]